MPKQRRISKTTFASVIGALIGGAFVLGGVLLAQYLVDKRKPSAPEPISAGTKVQISGSQQAAFFRAFRDVVHLPLAVPSSIKAWRMDLIGDGSSSEIFFTTDFIDKYFYYGVATDRAGSLQVLYYDKVFLGSSVDCIPFSAGNVRYLLFYSVGGSGAFLYAWILSYDGIHDLKTVWTGPGLGGGWYYFSAGKLLFSGNNVRYTLKYLNGSFRLQRDRDRYVRDSSTVHVLRIDTTRTRLIFHFDDQLLGYHFEREDAVFDKALAIPQTDLLVVDDNFTAEDRYVRILTSEGDGINFTPGYFWTANFASKGDKEINFSDSYSIWYHLNVKIQ